MSRARNRRASRRQRQLALRVRLSAVAAVVALFSVLGTGAAWAAWSAHDSASSTASAATVGVTQQLAASTLGITYGPSSLVGVGTVTVTNTSSRAGTYGLSLSATSASTTLPAAVTGEIGSAGSCTATATLTAPASAALSVGVTKSGAIAANSSVVLCVRTSMAAAGVTANPSASLTATIQASVTVGTWTATAAPNSTFTQSVAAAAPTEVFFTNSSPRYNILNANSCLAVNNNVVARNGVCDMWNGGQFRIADVGTPTGTTTGKFYISQAVNATSQPSAPRWGLTAATSTIGSVTAADLASQQWTIVQRTDGKYQLTNVQYGTCATVTTTSGGGGVLVAAATCGTNLASQGFTFTPIGNPIPSTPHAVNCSTNNGGQTYGYLILTWTFDPEYQQEASYRIRVLQGTGYVTITPNYLHDYTATAFVAPGDLTAAGITYAASRAIQVQQSIGGSPWATVAIGNLSFVSPGIVGCVP